MNEKRYRVEPKRTKRGVPYYAVIDMETGDCVSARDCQLWAERDAERINAEGAGEWSADPKTGKRSSS